MILICAWIKKNTVVVWLSLFKLTILLTEDDLSHFDRCVTACSINRLSFISSSSIRMKIDRSMTRLSTCCILNLTVVTTCFFYVSLKSKNMIKRLINRPPTCQYYLFLIDFSSNFSVFLHIYVFINASVNRCVVFTITLTFLFDPIPWTLSLNTIHSN